MHTFSAWYFFIGCCSSIFFYKNFRFYKHLSTLIARSYGQHVMQNFGKVLQQILVLTCHLTWWIVNNVLNLKAQKCNVIILQLPLHCSTLCSEFSEVRTGGATPKNFTPTDACSDFYTWLPSQINFCSNAPILASQEKNRAKIRAVDPILKSNISITLLGCNTNDMTLTWECTECSSTGSCATMR